MVRPLRRTLRAADGVRIEAEYRPAATGSTASRQGAAEGEMERSAAGAIVLAHGFTGALERPAVRRVAGTFTQYAAVVTLSFRGHGGSGGQSTLGDREVLDLAAAVRWARALGHQRIVTVGFSMGGSVVLRHGALYRNPDGDSEAAQRGDAAYAAPQPEHEGRTAAPGSTGTGGADLPGGPAGDPGPPAFPDAVVAVSSPARWYYRGTAPMRRLHWVVEQPVGRLVGRYGLGTRIDSRGWNPAPLPPVSAVPLIAPAPLLLVHGDRDPYFPLDHPRSLAEAAGDGGAELWTERGFGHAENAAGPELLHRIGAWVAARCGELSPARHDGTRNAGS